jgi:hypothetical protein
MMAPALQAQYRLGAGPRFIEGGNILTTSREILIGVGGTDAAGVAELRDRDAAVIRNRRPPTCSLQDRLFRWWRPPFYKAALRVGAVQGYGGRVGFRAFMAAGFRVPQGCCGRGFGVREINNSRRQARWRSSYCPCGFLGSVRTGGADRGAFSLRACGFNNGLDTQ